MVEIAAPRHALRGALAECNAVHHLQVAIPTFIGVAGLGLVPVCNLRDFAQALLDARVRCQPIRSALPRCAAFGARLVCGETLLTLEHFNHIDHVVRIVVEAAEIFRAELVRLRFLSTTVFCDIAGRHALRSLRCRVGSPSHTPAFERDTKQGCGDHADARRLLAGRALRTVARGDVADLMTDDTGQIGFAIHIGHDAARDIHVAAGQCEGIHVRRIEHREVPVQLRAVRGLRQALADVVDIGLHRRILVFAEFSQDLGMRFRPFCHLAFLVHDRALVLAGDGVFDGRTT